MSSTIYPTMQDLSKVDSKILHPLHSLRGKIRLYVVLEGILNALIFVAIWFWVGLFLDYGLFAIFGIDWVELTGKGLRGTILVVIVAALIALLLTRILLRLTKDFSAKSLALILERRFPQLLGDRLITSIELSDLSKAESYGYSQAMIRKTVDEVRERVEQLPLNQVFNWKRLYQKGYTFLAITFGGLVLIGIGYSVLFLFLTMSRPDSGTDVNASKISRSFNYLTGMWFDRNIKLKEVYWPRPSYIEFLDIPADQQVVHLGPNKFPYTVRVRAYKWVAVDSKVVQGVRPMTWKDVQAILPGSNLPKMSLDNLSTYLTNAKSQMSVMVPSPMTELISKGFDQEIKELGDSIDDWRLDRIENLETESPLLSMFLKSETPDLFDSLNTVTQQLEEKSDDPQTLREFRRLVIPQTPVATPTPKSTKEVDKKAAPEDPKQRKDNRPQLKLYGRKTRDEQYLNYEKKNIFSAKITKLTESSDMWVNFLGYSTPVKRIELVPAPTIVELKRTEYQPAYLYYYPILDDRKLPLHADPQKLKGLKQKVDDLHVSLSGDFSRFEIPMGTELTLHVTVDKPLREAWIVVPKPDKFPSPPGTSDTLRIPLTLDDDKKTIHFDFTASQNRLIARPTEFEIEFIDNDDVSSKRKIQIQPVEDPVPEVEVMVETLRKVGNVYVCTPKALIPFAKESKIKDIKGGMNRIEYRFSYIQLDSSSDLAAKASFVGLLFHNSPQMPSIAQGLYRSGMLVGFNKALRSDSQASPEQAVLLKSFQEEWEKRTGEGRLRTPEKLSGLLQNPLLGPADRDRLIETFDFNSSGNAPEEGFDLERVLPNLAVRDPESTPQPTYMLNLSVVATDTNVETGEARIGVNKEPLTFKIVSHIDLLAEIAREQTDLANKLDEVIRRVEDGQRKLFVISDRLRSAGFNASNKDEFLPEQTRMNELNESLAKSRDLTSEISVDYARILRELITNRFDRYREKTIKDIREYIVTPLQETLKDQYPKTEEAFGTLQSRLNASAMPEAGTINDAQSRISDLLARLRAIRAQITDTVQLDKLIVMLKELSKQQTNMGQSIEGLRRRAENEVFAPEIKAPAMLTLSTGQKSTVTLDLVWTVEPQDPYHLQLIPAPESDMKLSTARIDIKGTPLKVNFEVTAGTKKGDFALRIVPAFGREAIVTVTVK